MMQQGGVASITKPNAYLVRKTKKQQEQQQKLILQAAIFSLVDKKFDDIQQFCADGLMVAKVLLGWIKCVSNSFDLT